jgi:NAD(P)-dependent dehydrogenase (short-subunit alcohol dehydrogenase family)
VDLLVAEVKKRVSKLHILVNNSGATYGAPWDNVPEKAGWDRVMDLNVKAIFYCKSVLHVVLTMLTYTLQ